MLGIGWPAPQHATICCSSAGGTCCTSSSVTSPPSTMSAHCLPHLPCPAPPATPPLFLLPPSRLENPSSVTLPADFTQIFAQLDMLQQAGISAAAGSRQHLLQRQLVSEDFDTLVQDCLNPWVLKPGQDGVVSEDAQSLFVRFSAHLGLLLRGLGCVQDPRLLEESSPEHYRVSRLQETFGRIIGRWGSGYGGAADGAAAGAGAGAGGEVAGEAAGSAGDECACMSCPHLLLPPSPLFDTSRRHCPAATWRASWPSSCTTWCLPTCATCASS